MNRNIRKRARHQAGVSLIEILVAILVLSIGLLGMAGLQARALKGNNSALQRTQAVMLSYYVLDAMRVDKANALTGTYNMPKTCTVPTDTSTFVANVKKDWLQSLKDNLGNVTETCGMVSCQVSGVCTVEIYWDDSRAGGSSTQMVQTVSRL